MLETNAVVSIIMPVYKCEDYIRNSILSVENQTYPHIELVCINDSTPDNSFGICKELSEKYGNIVLVENDRNRGLEFTRNHGLSVATGKYILFLDSDDTISPDSLEQLVSIAESNESDIVLFTHSKIIGGEDNPIWVEGVPNGRYDMQHFALHILKEINIGVLCCVGAKLYNHEFIKKHSLVFDGKYKYNEDAGFILSALLNTDNVYFLNQPFYKYLIRTSNSIMSSYRPKMFDSISVTRELLKALFIQNGIWENEQKRADYYQEMLGLMLNSLINEVKFGDKNTFKETCEIVRNYKDFDEMCDCLKKMNRLSTMRKLILPFIRKRHWNIVYFLVKMQQIKK